MRLHRCTLLLCALAVWGMSCQACSPALAPPRGEGGAAPPGVRTPLPLPAEATPDLVAPPTALGAERGEASALASFTPLLSAPELELAAESVAKEEFGTAAAQVSTFLSKRKLAGLEAWRWHLLLGTLREKAGDGQGALEHYALAAEGDWPLRDYAALGLGRCLVGAGDLERADRELSRVRQESVAEVSARALLAEIACRRGDTEACLEHLQVFAKSRHKPAGWSPQAFRVVEMLVKELSTPRAQQAAIDRQAGTLELLRSLAQRAPGTAARFDVAGLERALLSVLPEEVRREKERLSPQARLALAEAMEQAGRNEDAQGVAGALLDDLGPGAYGPVACQARLVQGKALNRLRERERAVARLTEAGRHCKGDDVRAWALYLAGKYSFSDKRYAEAEPLFAELEREVPRHRLADDARLYRAIGQLEMGVESRFTELLARMGELYPKGDMTLDGLFALALRRLERSDWAGAATVLDGALRLLGPGEARRGQDSSGRERYFAARARIETGEVERGLSEYEKLIADLPLSYYTLHAYSRLFEQDAERARKALAVSLERPERAPFRIPHLPDFDRPGFVRGMELLRQGDIDSARRELSSAGVFNAGTSPAVLWGVATLYARSGSARHAHALPRWELTDWLEHWPKGTWRQAWDIAFPRPHIASVSVEAKRQGVEPALVYAVMREESAFNAAAVSSANAYGLMQIISPTARHYGKQVGLPFDRQALTTPEVSIAIGSRVLASYRERFFRDDPLLTIPGYNAGPGRPMRWAKDWPSVDFDVWVELIPFRETRRYTKRVLASRASYGFLYYRSDDLDPLRLPRRLNSSSTD